MAGLSSSAELRQNRGRHRLGGGTTWQVSRQRNSVKTGEGTAQLEIAVQMPTRLTQGRILGIPNNFSMASRTRRASGG